MTAKEYRDKEAITDANWNGDKIDFDAIYEFANDYHKSELKLLGIGDVSKRFDFDKLLQDYRQEFVNSGGYSRSDKFESGTEPYEVFEWFKKKLS